MHSLGAWVLFDFIFTIFIYFRVDFKSFMFAFKTEKY